MQHPEYSDELLEHFRSPRNVGEIADADARGEASSPLHGDTLRLTFSLEGERIREVRFRCLGCPVAIAAGSVSTEILRGATITEALLLTDEDIVRALGGVPERKRACSILVREALRSAFARLARS